MSKEQRVENQDMTMTPILSKYQYQKPKDFGDYMERCYPVSAVMDMLKEYSNLQNATLIKERDEFINSIRKSLDANDIEDSEFILKQCIESYNK